MPFHPRERPRGARHRLRGGIFWPPRRWGPLPASFRRRRAAGLKLSLSRLFRRGDRVAQFAAADDSRSAREGGPRRFLHLHLRQLASDAAVVRAWVEKYTPQGLVLIGVHTPEFAFEKNADNVRRALSNVRVSYPVAMDNDYAIWRAFNNQYWPALYFVDTQGRIRHHKFGEGEYEQSERMIQQLLSEAGASGIGRELVSVDGRGIEAAADWGDLKSRENYVSYDQTENFASPGGMVLDQAHSYAAPARLNLNNWALSGDWTVGRQYISLDKANGRIAYRFHARDLNLVMAPPVQKASGQFRVFLDGQPAGAAGGTDLDGAGNGVITQPRTYQLIRQPKPIVDRLFEIEFLDRNVQAFAFTFG